MVVILNHFIVLHLLIFLPNTENDDPACQPRDFLNSTPYFSDAIYNPGQSELIRECLPTCFRSEYFTKITEAEIEPRTLRRFANQTKGMKIGDPE